MVQTRNILTKKIQSCVSLNSDTSFYLIKRIITDIIQKKLIYENWKFLHR